MEWKIARGQGKCMSCMKPLEEGQTFFSALIDQGDDFIRKDYCPTCWESRTDQIFSFWATRVPRKDQPARPTVDDEVLLDFFLRLEAQDSPAKRNLRYLLALLLMRKRILKFEDLVREQEQEFLVLKQRGADLRHRVLDPKLSVAELNQLREDLFQVLYLEA